MEQPFCFSNTFLLPGLFSLCGNTHPKQPGLFNGKGISTGKFLLQKLNCIHRNPVSGKWTFVVDYIDYEQSSASFYELGVIKKYIPFDSRIV